MNRILRLDLMFLVGILSPMASPAQPVFLQDAADAMRETACLALNAIELPELVSIGTEWMPAGQAVAPDSNTDPDEETSLPSHCRVRGLIEPAIRFEVWLPIPENWNGRFLGAGGSFYAGILSLRGMRSALAAGYATASTDTGHVRTSAAWLGDDGLLRDFGYRAVYEMTAKAQFIVTSYYSRPADYRYFNGCSLGGRQGLMEAERFPDDYDGIVAGAPVNAFVATRTTQLWSSLAARPFAGAPGLLGQDVLARVSDAAIAQCDTLDGVLDGVLEDPRRCNFDPARLQCGVAGVGRCLTSGQVAAFRQIYSGPTDPEIGAAGLPGLAIGGETGWSFANSEDELSSLTLDFFSRAVFADPFWNWRSFAFPVDHDYALEEVGWILDATATDLSPYRDRGGKLILYHGWNDANNSPEATIAWYEGVEATLSGEANPLGLPTRDFARLFMVPGMGHCGGGPGTTEFDAQRAIEDWVERGIPPDRIEAASIEEGEVVRTRPLCPYPQTARYRGSGDSDRSGSFVCTN